MKTRFIALALISMLIVPMFGQTRAEYELYRRKGETFEQYSKRVKREKRVDTAKGVAIGLLNEYAKTKAEQKTQGKTAVQQTKSFKIYPVTALEAVDLGLPSGVLWGSCNLGATKPEGEGNRYAWGETKPKNKFTRDNYKYYQPAKVTKTGGGKDADGFDIPVKETKVPESWTQIGMDISGTKFDAATAALGDGWRMPSINDLRELNRLCKWEKTSKNDVKGFKITGPNGKWIFLPEVAVHDIIETYYWTSSFFGSSEAYHIIDGGPVEVVGQRYLGMPIRPIKGGMTEAQKAEARIEELKRQE